MYENFLLGFITGVIALWALLMAIKQWNRPVDHHDKDWPL